ncbi:MAG TPA: shikimate dehydrogenase [Gemmatimonadales bacterium]|nr:shikimate dehydrogenase [Gemmatimonadales bacterium]
MSRISGSSRLLVILGDPVAHSLSPAMQNSALRALGLDAAYFPLRVDGAALPPVIRGLEAAGVAGNITVPHKVAASQLLIRLTGVAKAVGAVNTFWPENGRLVGDNTDVPAILDALTQLQAGDVWVLAGTGGSARAVVGAARQRAATLLLRSRDPARGAAFAAWAREVGVHAALDDGRPAEVAINATPLGLQSADPAPIPSERLSNVAAVLDLVYAPGETRWVAQCRASGLRAADGRGVLVAQGAYALERFFPDQRAPREVMAAAVNHALRVDG